MIWFDLPRLTATRHVLTRTLRRAITREQLRNGNRERLRDVLSRDPHVNIVRWAWRNHDVYHEQYRAASRDPMYAHLRFIRIGSRADARRLLDGIG